MRSSSGLYLIIGVLIAVIVGGGYLYYQETHKTGIAVEVGGKGISVQTN